MVSLAIQIVSFVIVAYAALVVIGVVGGIFAVIIRLIVSSHDSAQKKRDDMMNKLKQAEHRRLKPIRFPDERPEDFEERMHAHRKQLSEDASTRPQINALSEAQATPLPVRDWLKEHEMATSNLEEYQRWRQKNKLPLLTKKGH